jgi:hypothetical protein
MTAVLGWALIAAGVLMIGVGLRMWAGSYYDDNPRLARVMLYGGAPWTMPIPMAGFGLALAGIGALIILPRQLTLFAVGVAVVGCVVGIVMFVWQPTWGDPPWHRRDDELEAEHRRLQN